MTLNVVHTQKDTHVMRLDLDNKNNHDPVSNARSAATCLGLLYKSVRQLPTQCSPPPPTKPSTAPSGKSTTSCTPTAGGAGEELQRSRKTTAGWKQSNICSAGWRPALCLIHNLDATIYHSTIQLSTIQPIIHYSIIHYPMHYPLFHYLISTIYYPRLDECAFDNRTLVANRLPWTSRIHQTRRPRPHNPLFHYLLFYYSIIPLSTIQCIIHYPMHYPLFHYLLSTIYYPRLDECTFDNRTPVANRLPWTSRIHQTRRPRPHNPLFHYLLFYYSIIPLSTIQCIIHYSII
jgi:hypothetical protein